jgi:hypothetical protein
MVKQSVPTVKATTKVVARVSNKLFKVGESFTINMYDNGYMVDVGGRNKKDDYVSSKVIVSTVDELIEVIREITGMTREN